MRLINGEQYELHLVSEAAKKHFAEPTNYTAFILAEWETLPYSEYIAPSSIILDIGSNVGLFALHVLPYAKKMICVEPTPAHMAINKEINYKSIHEQSALNSYTGKCRFHHEPVNTTMNTIRHDGVLEVDCITLKDLCDKHGLTSVDFCKVDIEGSEWQALTVDRIKEVSGIIKSFFVELHPRTAEAQLDMAARFTEAGYMVELVDYNGSIYCTI